MSSAVHPYQCLADCTSDPRRLRHRFLGGLINTWSTARLEIGPLLARSSWSLYHAADDHQQGLQGPRSWRAVSGLTTSAAGLLADNGKSPLRPCLVGLRRATEAAGPKTEDLIARGAGAVQRPRPSLSGPGPPGRKLQNPRCVFQILKQHFSRYTPEMVEQSAARPKEKSSGRRTLLANSGATAPARSLRGAWTQHTLRRADDSCWRCCSCSLATSAAQRGSHGAARHARSRLEDIPRCTQHSRLHNAPSDAPPPRALRGLYGRRNESTSYYGNTPVPRLVLKSMYGPRDADNDFGYDWHPKILGITLTSDFAAMAEGR